MCLVLSWMNLVRFSFFNLGFNIILTSTPTSSERSNRNPVFIPPSPARTCFAHRILFHPITRAKSRNVCAFRRCCAVHIAIGRAETVHSCQHSGCAEYRAVHPSFTRLEGGSNSATWFWKPEQSSAVLRTNFLGSQCQPVWTRGQHDCQ